jgi:DNA-binding NtrC family response regulator
MARAASGLERVNASPRSCNREAGGPSLTILLVEDEALILEIMAETLEDAGYAVTMACNGQDAIELIERTGGRFRALVSDVHMPGDVTGIDVASTMHRVNPAVPILLATGRPDAQNGVEAQTGHFAFLRKPYLPSQLLATLESMLAG